MEEKIKHGIYSGIIIILLGAIIYLKNCNNSHSYTVEQYNLLKDSLTKKINSKGEEISTTKTIVGIDVKDFLKIKSTDSIIKLLQEQVKQYRNEIKNGGNVTVIDNSTEISNKIISHIVDSLAYKVRRGDTVFVYSTYQCSDSTKWYSYYLQAKIDTCSVKFKVENEYSVVIGEHRDKWYKKKYPFVEVTNMNPFTKTKTLKTFEVKDQRKNRFSLGVGIGIGINTKLNLSPCIFGGLQYSLFKF